MDLKYQSHPSKPQVYDKDYQIHKLTSTIEVLKSQSGLLQADLESERAKKIEAQQALAVTKKNLDEIVAKYELGVSFPAIELKTPSKNSTEKEFSITDSSILLERFEMATAEIRRLRTENEMQQGYLEQILKEIEITKPQFDKERAEYASLLQENQHLKSDFETLSANAQKAHLENNMLQRKNKLLQEHNKDISHQVSMLFHDKLAKQLPITEDKLTFRDISELVRKNHQLLQLVTELRDTCEQLKPDNDQTILAMTQEIKTLKEQNAHKETKINHLIQQNEEYFSTNLQHSREIQKLRSQLVENLMDPYAEEQKEKMQGLQNKISMLEINEKKLNMKMASTLTAITRLEEEIVHKDQEKEHVIQDLKEKFQDEESKLSKENVQLSEQLNASEKRYSDCKKNLEEKEQQVRKYKILFENQTPQLNLVIENEKRVLKELEEVKKERDVIKSFTEDLKRRQHFFEENEKVNQLLMEEKWEKSKEKIKRMKTEHAGERENMNEKLKVLANQRDLLLIDLEAKQKEINFLEISKAQQLIEFEKSKLKGDSDNESKKESQANDNELLVLKMEVNKLQNQLEVASSRRDYYQDLLESAQQSLAEKSRVLAATLQQLSDETGRLNELNRTLQEEASSLCSQTLEYSTKQEALETENASLLKQVETLTKELSETSEKLRAVEASLYETSNKFQEHLKENFEITSRFQEMQTTLETVTTQQQEKEEAMEALKASTESQVKQLEQRIKELKDENDLVHSQLQDMLKVKLSQSFSTDEALLNEITLKEKDIEELQGVLIYVRKEAKLLEQKLSIAESECTKWKQKAEHALRISNEQVLLFQQARKELHMTTPEEYQRETQLLEEYNLQKLDNVTLMEENRTLQQEKEKLETLVEGLRGELGPLQLEKESLESQVKQLSSLNESLKSSCTSLKQRMTNIVDKYRILQTSKNEAVNTVHQQTKDLEQKEEQMQRARDQLKVQGTRIRSLTSQVETIQNEKKALEEQLQKKAVEEQQNANPPTPVQPPTTINVTTNPEKPVQRSPGNRQPLSTRLRRVPAKQPESPVIETTVETEVTPIILDQAATIEKDHQDVPFPESLPQTQIQPTRTLTQALLPIRRTKEDTVDSETPMTVTRKRGFPQGDLSEILPPPKRVHIETNPDVNIPSVFPTIPATKQQQQLEKDLKFKLEALRKPQDP